MYTLKGFATHGLFANNTPGQVNAIGELSTDSRTYSTEIGSYTDAANAPSVTLWSFLSATNGTVQVVDPSLATRVIAIANWFYNQTIQNAGQLFADQLLAGALAQFAATANTFASGVMVTDGTHWVPEWVSWTDVANPGSFIRIWFVDTSFQSQYDEFAFVFVPPITPLDDFFKPAAQVLAEVQAVTQTEVFTAIQTAKGQNPETLLINQSYNYNDPTNPANLIPTNWVSILYGLAGNTVDAQDNALEAYILANTSHTRDEWVAIFPDIFKRTEFTMIPQWQNIAIPARLNGGPGIYSPATNLTEALALLPQFASYPLAHINANGAVMGHPYKSLSILSIGSDQNRNNMFALTDVFPDLIMVSSTSTDFARMSQATQTFLLALASMLLVAETMTQYSSIPLGFTKLIRNGTLYLVYNYETIDFLVAAKSNTQFATPNSTL